MFKHIVRKRKALSAVMGAMLVASTYQASGCSVNLDQEFLQGVVDQLLQSGASFGGHFNRHGGGGFHFDGGGSDDGMTDDGGSTDGGASGDSTSV